MLQIKFFRIFLVLVLMGLGFNGNTLEDFHLKSTHTNKIIKEVDIIKDLRFGKSPKGIEKNSSSDRLLDLYLPHSSNNYLPVLIFIHGGGFSGGDKGANAELCKRISA